MMMRAYRRSFRTDGRAGRLSQSGLLDLMGQVDEKYSELHGHSTVARWESGTTLPTRERIEVFGEALNLSPAEIEGLIRLAGFDLEDTRRTGESQRLEESVGAKGDESVGATDRDGREEVMDRGWDVSTPFSRESAGFVLSTVLLPASYITVAGLVLTILGWDATWLLTLYVFVAIGLVLVQTLTRMVPSSDIRALYFASVFILLSIPLLQAPFIRMDPYGLSSIGSLADTPLPYAFALIANLIVAFVAGLMFALLRSWRNSKPSGGDKQPFSWAAWGTIPATVFVLLFGLAFSSVGVLIYLLSVLSMLAGVFMALEVLVEPDNKLGDGDRKYVVWAGTALAFVLFAFNGAAILAAQLLPGLISLPQGSLLSSWDINSSAFGYPTDEVADRMRLGALWASLASLVFVVVAATGYLTLTVPRESSESSRRPAAGSFSLVVLIGIASLALMGSAHITAPTADFDAKAEDVWTVPSQPVFGTSSEITVRYWNRSSLSGPHGGEATFDLSIVVQSPTGQVVRHEVDNQPFSYNQKWLYTVEHEFDETGTYTIHAEAYDIDGREADWDPLHRFDVRSEAVAIARPKGDH